MSDRPLAALLLTDRSVEAVDVHGASPRGDSRWPLRFFACGGMGLWALAECPWAVGGGAGDE